MAFILGGNSYNKDPLKLPKWQVYRQDLEVFYLSNSYANSFLDAQNTNFWGTASPLTALITSASVADTARTIVNLSNKKGWLTFGVGPVGQDQTATWVITVDGIATTFTIGGTGPGEYSLHASGFGLLFGGVYPIQHTPTFLLGGLTASSWYPNTNALNYADNGSGSANNSRRMPDPFWLSRAYPDSCVRFENSLTVTVASSVANSDNPGQNAGVMYVLDE